MSEEIDINRCKQCRRSFIQTDTKQKVCGTCKKVKVKVLPPQESPAAVVSPV